jgi:hypothetical protein
MLLQRPTPSCIVQLFKQLALLLETSKSAAADFLIKCRKKEADNVLQVLVVVAFPLKCLVAGCILVHYFLKTIKT